MSYKRLPKPYDRLRSQINWNTCILLVAISIVIAIIVLIELNIRRDRPFGLPGLCDQFSAGTARVRRILATLPFALVGESNA